MEQDSTEALLSSVTHSFGKIQGRHYAEAYMRVKDVDRRLSLRYISRGHKVLDVGGGLGLDDVLFAHIGAYPVVLDVNCDVLRTAKALISSVLKEIEFDLIAADALRMPFREMSFDVVVSLSAIDHLASKRKAQLWIREMVRVLRSKGRIVLVTSNRYWLMYPIAQLLIRVKIRPPELFFTPQELVTELRNSGILVERFDAGVLYYRGYSLIPSSIVNEILEKIANRFAKSPVVKKVCGRIGFVGVKK